MTREPQLDLERVIHQLEEELVSRRIDRGLARLGELEPLLRSLDPSQPGAGVVTGCLAQWIDVGFRRHDLLRGLVARFRRDIFPALSLLDYVYLRFALGM